jgi:hypothetical protein
MYKRLCRVSLALFSLVLCLGRAGAQVSWVRATGTIAGVVTDPTGAVIAGAEITITDESSGQGYRTRTESSGEYRYSPLPVGTYMARVAFRGFRTETKPGVAVTSSNVTRLDVALAVDNYPSPVIVASTVPVITIDTPANLFEITGSVFGLVAGPRSAPVRGAEVTFTSETSGHEYRVRTDSTSLYWCRALPVGSYKVRFRAPGFQEQTRTSIVVGSSDPTRLDIKLRKNSLP